MANLHVHRPSAYYGKVRKLKIFVDGEEAGTVGSDATTTLEVSPGNHEVYVKMDWIRSPPVAVAASDSDDVTLEVIMPRGIVAQWTTMFKPSKGFGLEHAQTL